MQTATSPISRILGDQTGANARAGEIGEFIPASVPQGAAVALTTNVAANVTSIVLTIGDWDLFGIVDWLFAATTSYTALIAGISMVSATLPSQAGGTFNGVVLGTDPLASVITPASVPTAGVFTTDIGPLRIQIPPNASSPATVFLVAQGTFTVAALSAFGTLRARRVQ